MPKSLTQRCSSCGGKLYQPYVQKSAWNEDTHKPTTSSISCQGYGHCIQCGVMSILLTKPLGDPS